jgi:hypothetical protein|tara:strand:+ start:173 stop:409 length:237 start_codon:yes stop_codon:yes gene_type:complete
VVLVVLVAAELALIIITLEQSQVQTDQELLTLEAVVELAEDLLALVDQQQLTLINLEDLEVQELSLYLLQTVLQGTTE